MPDTTESQAAIAANPRIQAAIQEYQRYLASPDYKGLARDPGRVQRLQAVQDAFRQSGIALPHDYRINQATGDVERKGWYARNPWIPYAGAAVTGGLAGGSLLGVPGLGGSAAAGPATGATGTATGLGAGTAGAATTATGTATGIGAAPTIASAAPAGGGFLGKLGTVGGIIDTAQQVGPLLSGIVGGRQAGREAENVAQNQRSILEQNRYGNELEAARLNLSAPNVRAQNSVMGDRLANTKPFSWTGENQMVGEIPVPQSMGGLSPDIFSENTRDLGRLMSAGAVAGQRTNDGRAVEAPPEIPDIVGGGTGDSILNTAATITNLMGTIPYRRQMQQAPGPLQTQALSSNIRWPTF